MDKQEHQSSQLNSPIDKRVALVTGASRGIGSAIAHELALQGYHVVLLARTLGALEEVDDSIHNMMYAKGELEKNADRITTLFTFDLRKYNKINLIGHAILEELGRLDALIGNAGILGKLGPIPHLDPKEWQKIFDINVTANFHLIRSLDPLLQASEAGRAVFISSSLANDPRAYWGGYTASKAALNSMIKAYALENETTKVNVNILCPGPVRTEMLSEAYPGGYQGETVSHEKIAKRVCFFASQECKDNGTVQDIRA